ncbi:MAG: hypothetical protein ACUVWP_01090 [bacterium]
MKFLVIIFLLTSAIMLFSISTDIMVLAVLRMTQRMATYSR